MNKNILIAASLLGVTSVILGAFGAHGLKELVSAESIQTFETGVRYQMYHAILLLFASSSSLVKEKNKKLIYYFVLLGIVFFSGSIYGLSTNELTTFNFKTIGFITPIGGLLLILAWVTLIVNFLKMKPEK